ncbi:hypothetical protein H6G96_15405 [Nostoc sp. FACHB-892]|nr:hypothetical protein [Nostoc sp. FACHB-892]MBD2727674.1 hypothetical protein [Nostoc sp. FACHB-892]
MVALFTPWCISAVSHASKLQLLLHSMIFVGFPERKFDEDKGDAIAQL